MRLIKAEHGDHFCIAVAGHPEGHLGGPGSPPPDLDEVIYGMDGWVDVCMCVWMWIWLD